MVSDSSVAAEALAEFYSASDQLDLSRLLPLLSEDIEVRFGNGPAMVGHAAAAAACRQFWASLESMNHEPVKIVANGNDFVQMAIVTYKLKTGKQVSMPVSSYFRRQSDGRFDRMWVYIDMAPLFA